MTTCGGWKELRNTSKTKAKGASQSGEAVILTSVVGEGHLPSSESELVAMRWAWPACLGQGLRSWAADASQRHLVRFHVLLLSLARPANRNPEMWQSRRYDRERPKWVCGRGKKQHSLRRPLTTEQGLVAKSKLAALSSVISSPCL